MRAFTGKCHLYGGASAVGLSGFWAWAIVMTRRWNPFLPTYGGTIRGLSACVVRDTASPASAGRTTAPRAVSPHLASPRAGCTARHPPRLNMPGRNRFCLTAARRCCRRVRLQLSYRPRPITQQPPPTPDLQIKDQSKGKILRAPIFERCRQLCTAQQASRRLRLEFPGDPHK